MGDMLNCMLTDTKKEEIHVDEQELIDYGS